MVKRKLHIAVLSDVHLGAYACHAKELLKYLQSITPEVLILNGDFIDPLERNSKKLPKSHRKVIAEIIRFSQNGTKVYLISDDKERVLQSIPEFSSFQANIRTELVLQLKGEKYWIFHGSKKYSHLDASFLGKLSRWTYRLLVNGDKMINKWTLNSGRAQLSYIGRLRNKAKHAIHLIEEFETTAIRLAAQQNYNYVICGHIHEPAIKMLKQGAKTVQYMNAGDWVENLTALEYRFEKWSIYKYDEIDYTYVNPKLHVRSKKKKRACTDNELPANTSAKNRTRDTEVSKSIRKVKGL